MDNYIKIIKSISDETRIKILRILLEAKKALCVCEIVDSLNIPFYNISKHIKELKNSGLVKELKNGRFVFYSVKEDKDDCFKTEVFNLINSIPDNLFKENFELLNKRLSLREDNKCVIGMNDKKKYN